MRGVQATLHDAAQGGYVCFARIWVRGRHLFQMNHQIHQEQRFQAARCSFVESDYLQELQRHWKEVKVFGRSPRLRKRLAEKTMNSAMARARRLHLNYYVVLGLGRYYSFGRKATPNLKRPRNDTKALALL